MEKGVTFKQPRSQKWSPSLENPSNSNPEPLIGGSGAAKKAAVFLGKAQECGELRDLQEREKRGRLSERKREGMEWNAQERET